MKKRLDYRVVLVWTLAVMLTVNAAEAQQQWDFEGVAGVGIPGGNLADAAGVGPAFGASFGYALGDAVRLRVGGQVELLSGGDYDAPSQIGREAPEVTLWHYQAGLDYQLLNEGATEWSMRVGANLGATTFDSDFRIVNNPQTDELVTDVSGTYFSPSAAVVTGYNVNRQMELFIRGEVLVIFADSAETGGFEGLSEGQVEAFESVWSVPATIGVRYSW